MKKSALLILSLPLLLSGLSAQDKKDDGTNWNGVTLGQITDAVQRRTKKRFLIEEQVNSAYMQKKVRYLSDRPLTTPEEFFAVYKSILQVNQLILVPAGKEGDEIWKIQPAQLGQRPAVPFDRGEKDPTDSYVTRVFSLKYADVRQVHGALINLANPQSITLVESASLLIVTDYDFNIKRLEAIITALDVKKPDIAFEMIQLQNALAQDVETMMNNLVQTLISRQGGRAPVVPGLPNQEQVKIVADKRTNSILIIAEPVRMEQIRELVTRLDRQAPFETSNVYIRHLKHTDAVDMSRTLNALYKISVDDNGIPSGGAAAPKPNQPIGPQPSAPPSGTGSSGSTGSEPMITANKLTNSVIIITDRNTYRTLDDLVTKLDQSRPQVLITATVVEVRSEDGVDIGVELNRATDPKNHITSFIRDAFGQSTILPNGNTFDITPVDTQGLTLAIVKDRIGFIAAQLKLKKSKVSVEVLDEPEATTADNSAATMTVTQQVPVLQTTVTGTGVAQTTFNRFETAQTLLTISPHISEGGYLRLETKVQIEKFAGTSPDPTIPPPKTTRSIETKSVKIASGRTIVIGGIVTQDKSETVTSTPFLGDIPIIGALFRRTQQSDSRRTLYIFITPYILYDESGGDLRELTRSRRGDIEKLRNQGLKNLSLEDRGDPVPYTTFRFRKPSTWDVFIDEPRKRE